MNEKLFLSVVKGGMMDFHLTDIQVTWTLDYGRPGVAVADLTDGRVPTAMDPAAFAGMLSIVKQVFGTVAAAPMDQARSGRWTMHLAPGGRFEAFEHDGDLFAALQECIHRA